ncbi:autotransporter outer membrane beta-barrel domain-containing protein [Litorivivens sp.]|uniref:autotransporter outer membrane beta-barrel domain-containing protein n=1 Tax=Litorivivens sp. TaxID=2020868 RepID=UPI0035648976
MKKHRRYLFGLVSCLLCISLAQAQTGATGSNGDGHNVPPPSQPSNTSDAPACKNDCKKEEEVSSFESVKGSAVTSSKSVSTAVGTMGRALRSQSRPSGSPSGQKSNSNQGNRREKGGGASADSITDSGRLSPFIIISGAETDKRETSKGVAFEQTEKSLLIGADYRLNAGRIIGAVASYSDGDTDLQANLGESATESYLLGVYASQYWGGIYLDAFIGYGELDIESERGASGNRLHGSTDGNFHTADLSLGINHHMQALSVSPAVRLSHTRGKINRYTETAAGTATPTTFNTQTFESLNASASISVSYATPTDWGVLIPTATFAYIHEYIGAQSIETSAAGQAQVQITEAPVKNYKDIELSLVAQFRRGASAFFSYAVYADNELFDRESINLGIRYELP